MQMAGRDSSPDAEYHVHTTCGKRLVARSALALLVLLGTARAWAQDGAGPPPPDLSTLSLEELVDLKIDSVYGASAYLQKVTEAPSSVTIITAEEIARFGHRTLADVLRSVRGFYVTSDRNYSYLGVRGFSRPGDYNARVLLLVDGHRLNDNIFGSALIGTEFPLDVELIDRVEIIRGPSSSLYGTSAFFAVINVITKRGQKIDGLQVSGAGGSLETGRARATYGREFPDGLGMLFSGSYYRSAGQRRLYYPEFDDPSTNAGIAENADSDSSRQLLATLTYGTFTLQGLYGTRDKRVPTASFDTVFDDPRSGTIETQGYVDLQYERGVKAGWHLASRLYYDRYGYDGDYVYENAEGADPPTVVNKDFARGNWWGAELKLSKRFSRRQTVAVGSEFRDNIRQDQYNYDRETGVQHLDDQRSSQNWALYVQDELAITNTLLVNLGLRHDQYDTFGGTTNPRAGVIYNPAPRTALKLLYGQAFRAPNAYELYWHQDGLAKANPALQPETNRTSELVLEQYVGSRFRLAATGYYYNVRDLITQQTDPADDLLVYNNVEAVTAHGLELELEGKWARGIEGRVSYTLQDSRNDDTDQRLTNSPAHLAHLNLSGPLGSSGVFAGLEVRYLSARQTLAGRTVAAAFVPNLTFFKRRLAKNVDISAAVYNLFDTKYADPGSEEHRQDSILQNGRTARIRVTVTLPRTH
jgi:iron complex outermembrane receptor protein